MPGLVSGVIQARNPDYNEQARMLRLPNEIARQVAETPGSVKALTGKVRPIKGGETAIAAEIKRAGAENGHMTLISSPRADILCDMGHRLFATWYRRDPATSSLVFAGYDWTLVYRAAVHRDSTPSVHAVSRFDHRLLHPAGLSPNNTPIFREDAL